MIRSLASYDGCKATAVASGSLAQMTFFVSDAKHDIAELSRVVQRVAALNPDAGEIGPGMLKNLVADARRALEVTK